MRLARTLSGSSKLEIAFPCASSKLTAIGPKGTPSTAQLLKALVQSVCGTSGASVKLSRALRSKPLASLTDTTHAPARPLRRIVSSAAACREGCELSAALSSSTVCDGGAPPPAPPAAAAAAWGMARRSCCGATRGSASMTLSKASTAQTYTGPYATLQSGCCDGEAARRARGSAGLKVGGKRG